MVRLFVRLKLRLIRGNLRGDTIKQLGFVFSVIGAVVAAVAGFLLFSLVRLAPADVALDIGIVAFTLFTIGWILVPLLAFGLDETLDPSRLSLFPLTTRQLAIGMFAASATGPWPLASLIVLAGGVVGLASGLGGVLLGLVAVVLQFALCLVASRALTTALSGALRSRRGRDLLAVAAVFVVLLFQLPNLLLNRGLPGDPRKLLESAGSALRWTPPGLAAHAIADGGLIGVAELIVVAMVVVVLAWLWIAALQRALVTPDSSNQSGGSVRRSRIARFLPGGMLGAVVAKELKYARREPRGRISWFTAIAVSGIIMFSLRGPGGWQGPAFAIAPACLAALMIGLQAANVFGIDGRSLWMNAVAFSTDRDLRTDLAGRHLAIAIIAVPLLTVVSVVAALVAGNLPWALVAALTAWGVLGVALGVGSVTSVILPYTFPDRLNAFSGAAPGQGGQAFLASFGAMLGTSMIALPVVLPVLLGAYWLCVLAVPYGLLIAWAGRRLGASIGFNRMPDLVAAVSRPT
ncbi:ABC-2 type transport system permease protein [Planotetraspora sp. GP83]